MTTQKSGLTKEQIKSIQNIVHDEFYGNRLDYLICKDESGGIHYIHESEIDQHDQLTMLSADDAKKVRDESHKAALSSPALSPIELRYKKQYLEDIKTTDESKFGAATDENIRHKQIIEPADYYSESILEKIGKHQFSMFLVLLSLLALLYYIFVVFSASGEVIVRSVIPIKSLSIEGKTYTGRNSIAKVSTGLHELKIYTADSLYIRMVHIKDGQRVLVELDGVQPHKNYKSNNFGSTGFVKFVTNLPPDKAMIDEVGVSSNNWVKIEEGKHTFSVVKEGYKTIPPFRTYHIGANDSISVSFNLVEDFKDQRVFTGTIEITSNVSAADIYLNGQNTGYKSSYFLSGLVAGTYRIHAKKNGYTTRQPEQTMVVESSKPFQSVHFTLDPILSSLVVKTQNAAGKIYFDDKLVGTGSIVQKVVSGKHKVSFGDVSGFHTPATRTVDLSATSETTISATYYPVVKLDARVTASGLSSSDMKIKLGFVQFGKFKTEAAIKPKSILANGEQVLDLSHPFPYNNPVAGHAIQLDFTLPSTFSFEQDLSLVLDLEKTSESYSATGSLFSEISILVNGNRKLLNQKITSSKKYKFKINNMLRNGENDILIYLTDKNTSHLYLKKIELN